MEQKHLLVIEDDAAICELLDLTDRIRELILERRPTSEIKKAARDEGMRFLRESAVERGFDDVEHLESDEDLAPLRGDPRFRKLLARIA